MLYKTGDRVDFTVRAENVGGPVERVQIFYAISDERNIPPSDPARSPRTIGITVEPQMQPFSPQISYTVTIPEGIIGGHYVAYYRAFAVGGQQTQIQLSDSYAIDVIDDPGHELPPPPVIRLLD